MLFVLVTKGGPQGQQPTSAALSLDGITHGARSGRCDWIPVLRWALRVRRRPAGNHWIPNAAFRAILGTALFAGVFFFVISLIMVWAYGTSPAQLLTLANSDSVVGDAADQYIGVWMVTLITFGGMAKRIWHRDGFLHLRGEPNVLLDG